MGRGTRTVEGVVRPHSAAPNASSWQGKRVLVTGHTGFKGAWLVMWLQAMGADVVGVSLDPPTTPSLFELARVADLVRDYRADIRSADLTKVVEEAEPEVVFHLAAQALVRVGYADAVGTWSTNLMGTVAVLDALCGCTSTRAAVFVTTDKVYRNLETTRAYCEGDELGGLDPYSASKAATELAIASYREAFLAERGIAVASARAGNVIGGGDWALDRLLPDAARAWQIHESVEVRRPASTRPWQHVLDPLAAYLVLAERMLTASPDEGLSTAWNFGPPPGEQATVREVIELAREGWGGGGVTYTENPAGPHEAGLLALDTRRAAERLGLTGRWGLSEAVRRTMRWYRQLIDGADARDLCLADLAAWEAAE